MCKEGYKKNKTHGYEWLSELLPHNSTLVKQAFLEEGIVYETCLSATWLLIFIYLYLYLKQNENIDLPN